jgi:hypothetical protein
LKFQVQTAFLRQYDVHVVGDAIHREYWIPADDLIQLNSNIVGTIEIVGNFAGRRSLKAARSFTRPHAAAILRIKSSCSPLLSAPTVNASSTPSESAYLMPSS